MLYKGRVFAVTSSVVQGSSVCSYITDRVFAVTLRVKCQVLYKGQVFEVTSSA